MPTIFSKDLLFLHVPKTGGTSVSQHLLNVLPRPIFYVQRLPIAGNHHGLVHVPGWPHHPLQPVAAIADQRGFALSDFRCILAVIRNPYDWAVSLYSFYRMPLNFEEDRPLIQLARQGSFKEFVLMSVEQHGLEFISNSYDYFHLAGSRPPNLCIVKYERLAEEVSAALSSIGIVSERPFPWLNRSERDEYESYYDPETEAAVYRQSNWMFDEGFYQRLSIAAPRRADELAEPV